MSNLIAETILHQLGGPRFVAMTGARNLVAHADGLSFRLPARFAKDGIDYVRITLTEADDYTIETGRVIKLRLDWFPPIEGIYADQLRDVFTSATGLDTSLGRMSA